MPIYTKSQRRYAIEEINRHNPGAVFPMTETNVIFGTPKAIPVQPDGCNAEVIVRARQRRDYIGNQVFRYPRLDLAVYFKNVTPIITLPNITKANQATVNINGRYGLNLIADDIEPVTLVAGEKFILRMTDKCLQFHGSVECIYRPAPYNLGELIVNPSIIELLHPLDPKLGKLCAKLIGYNIDFSDHYTFLQSIREGGLSGGENQLLGRTEALLDLMEAKGFPRWNPLGAKYKIYNTTAIADSNQQYDKVAVITEVNDPNIGGDFYLHFNI